MTAIAGNDGGASFDPDALRARYRIERDRRLRRDGEEQYLEVRGDFSRFNDEDPHVEPGFSRDPWTDEIDIAIVGGGFSGLLAAVRLQELGLRDFRLVEAGGDFGGTWYWNRYPGAQCDIDSYCYLPLLEELSWLPKEKYSYAAEIFEHSRRIGREYGLYERTMFQTRVTEMRWDEAIKRWRIRTDRDDELKARFVVMALGTYSRAKLPGIVGINCFKGRSFHTSRWDYAYTGGDARGDLVKLADRKVAVIGTGATAIQCVPHLGRHAGHLYVVQRTPSSVDLRGNKPTDPNWASALEPGWQRVRRENFNDILVGNPFTEDLVNDGWTDVFRRVQAEGYGKQKRGGDAARQLELADFEKMNEIRSRIDATVADRQVAEALKPWYRQFCKRPTFNDDYLPTFNRPNVTLVDVSGSRGVERITEQGLIANGREYEVDCIIYATGFEAASSFKRRTGFGIFGRGGTSIYDHWADGFRTLHGFTTHGFPNWFYMGRSQNALSVNFTAMIDDQARHVAHMIERIKAGGYLTAEPSLDAQAAWVATVRASSQLNTEFYDACTPGTYNNEGQFHGGLTAESYAAGINAFNAVLAQWREQDGMPGLILEK